MPTTRDDIDTLVGNKLRLVATDDGLIALTPLQQSAEPVEHGVLGLRAPLLGEGVMLVTREPSGEVLAHIAISHLLSTIHQYLRTVIQLWNALYRQQQG